MDQLNACAEERERKRKNKKLGVGCEKVKSQVNPDETETNAFSNEHLPLPIQDNHKRPFDRFTVN